LKRRPTRSATPAPAPLPAWWAPLTLAIAGLAVYANSFAGVFLFDDLGTIVRNPAIRQLTHLGQVLLPPADTALAGRPLVQLSFAINYALGGLDVWGYHVVNLALHLSCACLIYALIRRVAPQGLAFAVALLWTVHPLNTEVVNYITERTESMMALCLLLTLYCAARQWRVAAVAVCALGMLCKETMAVAPIAVGLYEWAASAEESFAALWRRRWPFYVALSATWIVPAGMLVTRGQTLSAGFATAHVSSWTYLLNQPALILRYLRLALWPSDLVLYYGWPRALHFSDVWVLFAIVATLVIASIVALMKWRPIGAAAVWVFLFLGPTSSLLPIATEVGAERRMYLPLIGVLTLGVIGLAALARRTAPFHRDESWSAWPAAVVAIATVAFGATTFTRNAEYATSLGMARTVLERWPTANAEQMVGTELIAAGRQEEAIPHLQAAVVAYPPARLFLGEALLAAGKHTEAIAELERFTREEPALAPVRTRMMIAKAYGASGQMPEAIEHLTRVLALDPNHTEAHGLIGEALTAQKNFADAVPHYQAYLAANPGSVIAWSKLGLALAMIDRVPEARAAFERAVAIDPSYGPAVEALKQLRAR